jgi:threonine synthase
MTSLACAWGCGRAVPILSGAVTCPSCGGLLDPVFDMKALARRSAASWRKLFDARAAATGPLARSGVWAHHEWVLPEIGEGDVVTLGEGRSPLVPGPAAGGARLLVKQCGQQPTGSFKDLGMTVLVSAAQAMRRGKAAPGKARRRIRALVCASTGDTSAALAAYGARAGIPVVVLLPAGKVSPAQLAQPLAHGAKVIELEGSFDDCMRVVQEIGAREGFLLANSKNPLRLLGQATVAFEIVRDLGWRAPDVVVVPSGNLGNVAALHMGFSLLLRLGLTERVPRLVAAQVRAADPLHRARVAGYGGLVPVEVGETMATAIRIGHPVSFPRARTALIDSNGTTTSASEEELAQGMGMLDRSGLFSCPQTGAAMAGILQLKKRRFFKKNDTIVLVSTASGLKFVEAKMGAEANRPLRAPADVEAVARAVSS